MSKVTKVELWAVRLLPMWFARWMHRRGRISRATVLRKETQQLIGVWR